MNVPFDHECFQWEWATGKHSSATQFYFCYNDDNVFGWVNLKNGEFNRWGTPLAQIERAIAGREWIKLRKRPTFCGPMQPPPSKVILKIRQMEARRKHVY